ncbi:hypothetical protein ACFLT9_06660 [Acidobacteriota bacterium]
MTKQSLKIHWAGSIGIAVLILINVLLVTGVIDSNKITSHLARFTAQDGNIEHPLGFLWIIQGEILLIFCAIYYFLKQGKRQSISLLTAISLFITMMMLGLAFIFYRSYDSEFLWWMYAEDYFFENLTAFLHLGSAFLFIVLFIRSRKLGISRLVSFLPFAFFFFVGMEEISWGQRLFGLETPGFMKGVNTLGETNIHNILPVENREPVYIGFFLLVSIIFMLTGLIEKKGKSSKLIGKIIPILPPGDFYYFGLLIISMLILPRYLIFWEVIEQIFGVICATYAIHIYLRFRKGYSQILPHPSRADD